MGVGHRSRHRERGPRRGGVWESTSPRSPWLRAWGWGHEGCSTWAWLRLNQGQGPTSVDTPRGSPRNGAGESDPGLPRGLGNEDEGPEKDVLEAAAAEWKKPATAIGRGPVAVTVHLPLTAGDDDDRHLPGR